MTKDKITEILTEEIGAFESCEKGLLIITGTSTAAERLEKLFSASEKRVEELERVLRIYADESLWQTENISRHKTSFNGARNGYDLAQSVLESLEKE